MPLLVGYAHAHRVASPRPGAVSDVSNPRVQRFGRYRPSVEIADERRQHLAAFERRTSVPMIGLAFAFLAVYATQILWLSRPAWVTHTLDGANVAIWLVFVVELGIRAYLSGKPGEYLMRHPIDLMLVALPMLRPLRVLRVFTAANFLATRSGRFALGRTLVSAIAATALVMVITSLAMYDVERNAPGATIRSFGTALWWAGQTVTTVGYGDATPVTSSGRMVAFGLMLVGISLLGLITASAAAWFVAKTREAEDEVIVELRSLRAEVAELRKTIKSD